MEEQDKQQERRKKRRKIKEEKDEPSVITGVPETFTLLTGLPFNPNYFVSMPTGLEAVCIEEIKEKLDPISVFAPFTGKVVFTTTSRTPLQVAQALRSVDKLYVCVAIVNNVVRTKEEGLAYLENLAKTLDWGPSIETWNICNPSIAEANVSDKKPLSFRASFHRANAVTSKNVPKELRQSEYSSMEAAACFGSGVNERLQWTVNLKEFDVEVFCHLLETDSMYVGLSLSQKRLSFRNIANAKGGTLRPSIAYAMAYLAKIKPGYVVVDPMCGGGIIPIEAALGWPGCFVMGGDIKEGEPERALENIQNVIEKERESGEGGNIVAEVFQWNVKCLPLRNASVDAVVSDLPFGKRHGTKGGNKVLYPALIAELTRVCKVGAYVVLLTLEVALVGTLLHHRRKEWNIVSRYGINCGGLRPTLFVLERLDETLPPEPTTTTTTQQT